MGGPAHMAALAAAFAVLAQFASAMRMVERDLDLTAAFTSEATGCQMLDVSLEKRCNNLAGKDPAVPSLGDNGAKKKVAVDDYDADPGAFERRLGRALAHAPVVQGATEEFGRRLFKVIVGDSAGAARTKWITDAFAAKCSTHNTGFFSQDPAKIEEKLMVKPGNIREIWEMVYCLTKNKPVIIQAFDAVTKEDMEKRLGKPAGALGWDAVLERRAQVQRTKELAEEHRRGWGITDYIYPPLNNWARFTFELKDSVSNTVVWKGARTAKGYCDESNLTSDSPDIYPPLSPDELAAECGGAPRCKLQWYPGIGCYTLNEDNVYMRVAKSLGYRVAAGPSGTTADVLALALLLGFTQEDLLAFRTTMLAWMLPVDDHSYVEIMLGANSFLPPKYKMQVDHVDFNQLWPASASLTTSWGASYSADEVWVEVRKLFPKWQ